MSDIIRTTARFQEAQEPVRQKPIIQIDNNYNSKQQQLPNTIRSSIDSGRDNPFKPDGIIYKSADPIVDYYKYGPNQSRAQSPSDSQLLIGSKNGIEEEEEQGGKKRKKSKTKRKRDSSGNNNNYDGERKSCWKRWFCCCCSCFKCCRKNNDEQTPQQPPIVTIVTTVENEPTSSNIRENITINKSSLDEKVNGPTKTGASLEESSNKNKSLNIEFVDGTKDNQNEETTEEENTDNKKKKKMKKEKEKSTQAKITNPAKSSKCVIS